MSARRISLVGTDSLSRTSEFVLKSHAIAIMGAPMRLYSHGVILPPFDAVSQNHGIQTRVDVFLDV